MAGETRFPEAATLLFPTSTWSRISDRLLKEKERGKKQIAKQNTDSEVSEGGEGRGGGGSEVCGEHAGLGLLESSEGLPFKAPFCGAGPGFLRKVWAA